MIKKLIFKIYKPKIFGFLKFFLWVYWVFWVWVLGFGFFRIFGVGFIHPNPNPKPKEFRGPTSAQMSNINNNLILIINNSRFLKCLFMIEYRQFFTKFIIMSNTINQHTVKCLKCNIDLQFKKPSLE